MPRVCNLLFMYVFSTFVITVLWSEKYVDGGELCNGIWTTSLEIPKLLVF